MKFPTRQQLSVSLLETVYAEEMESMLATLKNKNSWLSSVMDGPIQIVRILLSEAATSDTRGEYLASSLSNVIGEVNDVIDKGAVCAVVSGKASNMRKPWVLLITLIPNLTYNGGAAHTMKLKDMFGIEYMVDVLKKAVTVSKLVCKRVPLWCQFRAKQRSHFGSATSFVKTRWYSAGNSVPSIVRNEEVLQDIFSNDMRYSDAAVKLLQVQNILATGSKFRTDAILVLRLTNPAGRVGEGRLLLVHGLSLLPTTQKP
ncbi:LOW QUALITY PROTEIN: hypothetical protein PHMEG_0008602 [Phytophthora megakarya]|uniref:Uncharacterized protein n=1 Tax=Phytophthora megakarya TaxID=4795 RepID=A0A225WIR3_9STRA|nr:LOW QUALITY PROTEIN: hypothetical protein PHMEG_0008602 [Phytophthora megakarya]